MRDSTPEAQLGQIQQELSTLKLDDSLLFLNHLLGVSRGERKDPALEQHIRSRKAQAPAFVIHFLAKQLLLHGSNLGVSVLDGPRFVQLQDSYFQINDPIVDDPHWKDADPSGFFERLLTQQLPAQRRNMIQKYGLALGLFRDAGPVVWPVEYDLRADIEGELGMPLERFMAMGFLCHFLRRASLAGHDCNGTFNHMYLANAFAEGFTFCVPDVWSKFLGRTACDRDNFRASSSRDEYQARDKLFAKFEFNLLHRFPIIDVGEGRFIAVDPNLIVERTTLGLFYDLFERDKTAFAEKFGYVFDQFVGQLLKSVCDSAALWSAAEWERRIAGQKSKNSSKVGDWCYLGKRFNVLIECKSLRPSLELTTYGSDDGVKSTQNRIASALEQLIRHDKAIQLGEWEAQGLKANPAVGVITTYGRIQTVNGSFFRKRIRQILAGKGLRPIPYLVLSIEELDMVIRLVELGSPLDEIIASLVENEDSFEPLAKFAAELKPHPLSSYTYAKGTAFMDTITPEKQPSR